MARYRNGELLAEEIPVPEVDEQQQQQATPRTTQYAGGAVLNPGTTGTTGTTATTRAGSVYGTGTYDGSGIVQPVNGKTANAVGTNTETGITRTPLTYTRPDGTVGYDPRGASMVLTQFANSQMDEPTLAESERTQAALARLQDWETNRPGAWQSRYDDQINSILNGLGDREAFSYNPEEDPLYRNARDQYIRLGNRAMQDSMANAAGMTGGYGNTYAANVGQQAYQDYLSQLNGQLPEYYDRAYQRYNDETGDIYNRLNALMSQDSTDYGRYRDLMGDWRTDRAYLEGRYNTETGNDLTRYQNDLAQWQADRDFYYNMLNAMIDDPLVAQAAATVANADTTGGGGGGGGGRGSASGRNKTLGSGNMPLQDAITTSLGDMIQDTGNGTIRRATTGIDDETAEKLREMGIYYGGMANTGNTNGLDAAAIEALRQQGIYYGGEANGAGAGTGNDDDIARPGEGGIWGNPTSAAGNQAKTDEELAAAMRRLGIGLR